MIFTKPIAAFFMRRKTTTLSDELEARRITLSKKPPFADITGNEEQAEAIKTSSACILFSFFLSAKAVHFEDTACHFQNDRLGHFT